MYKNDNPNFVILNKSTIFCFAMPFILWFLVAFFAEISAQSLNFDDKSFLEERNHLNKRGMQVLLGWSALNLTTGIYGNFAFEGRSKYFHQMNAAWNTVNLGLAVHGLLTLGQNDGSTIAEIMKSGQQFEKVLLFNAGLDVGYMAFGLYLRERGKRQDDDRWYGYGNSMMLQGAFLFAFDWVLFYLNVQQNKQLYEVLSSISLGYGQMGVRLNF